MVTYGLTTTWLSTLEDNFIHVARRKSSVSRSDTGYSAVSTLQSYTDSSLRLYCEYRHLSVSYRALCW